MDGAVLVAVLGCVGTIIGSGLGAVAAASKTNFRLEQLEKKVDKHNGLVERMVAVEERSKSNTHRIDAWEQEYIEHN
jgi:hypothetical protein